MPAPVSNFNYLIEGLQCSFTDLSTNNPTTWNWDFGDTGNSSSQHPIHLYSANGTYTVSLTTSNGDGESEVFSRDIVVTVPTTMYVNDFISADLPEGLQIIPEHQDIWVKKWQLLLHTAIDPHINTPDVHNDSIWPNLANALIAKLVIHDAYSRASQGAMVLLLQSGSGSEESSNENIGSVEKSIETGPTKVEWANAADMVSAMLKKGAGEDGASIFDLLRQQICRLASHLRIQLAMCPKLSQPIIIPGKLSFYDEPVENILRDYYNG